MLLGLIPSVQGRLDGVLCTRTYLGNFALESTLALGLS